MNVCIHTCIHAPTYNYMTATACDVPMNSFPVGVVDAHHTALLTLAPKCAAFAYSYMYLAHAHTYVHTHPNTHSHSCTCTCIHSLPRTCYCNSRYSLLYMIESMHSHLFLCGLVCAIWQLKFVLEQVGLIAAVTKPDLARLISPPLYL